MLRKFIVWIRTLLFGVDTYDCICGHLKCMHQKGKGPCCEMQIDFRYCRCQKFIRDNNGGRGRSYFPTPSPEDLERMVR